MAGNWGRIRIASCGVLVAALGASGCSSDSDNTGNPAADGGSGGAGGSDAGAGTSGASGEGGTPANPNPTADDCFADISDGVSIDYASFNPKIGSHCMGTNNQDITDIERVVFLGDSVTTGTPPSKAEEFFRILLGESLKKRFPGVEIDNCSAFGARTDDFLLGKKQVQACFPDLFEGDEAKAGATDDRRTLVIFTIGGNDLFAWAEDELDEATGKQAATDAAQLLEDAVAFVKDDKRFPSGGFVIYGNPYEFTDGTGDVTSCPLAGTLGLSGNQIGLAPAVTLFTERFMDIAVTHNADMIFMLEHFCGHGFHYDDETTQCYRGPDAENWFDGTCIHPNPKGHAVIAEMFEAVIAE
jgi:lysophospholipase L1-like esterase